jgi:hypothetical protein
MAQPWKDGIKHDNRPIDFIRAWFERDLGHFARWDRDVEVVKLANDGSVVIRIYTDTNCYGIDARPGIMDPEKPLLEGERRSYLGCIASSRKPRVGEKHTRGNDLRDGYLSEETWSGILADIVSYEMVQLQKQSSRVGRQTEFVPTHVGMVEGKDGEPEYQLGGYVRYLEADQAYRSHQFVPTTECQRCGDPSKYPDCPCGNDHAAG